MAEETLGDVANRFLFENDRVRVWEMRLEPGEGSALHHHELPYLLCILEGTSIDADYANRETEHAPVKPGHVYYQERGTTERAVNRGDTRFREILIELKD
jgi:beta-alanine degradation protein BauB